MSHQNVTISDTATNEDLISLGEIQSRDNIFSFLNDDTYIENNNNIRGLLINKKINKELIKVENEEKLPIKKFQITNWITPIFYSTKPSYPILKTIYTMQDFKSFIKNERHNFTPNYDTIKNYKMLDSYQDKILVNKLKDVNDKTEYFRRSYNRLIASDIEQNKEEEKIINNIRNKDYSTLMNSSVMFSNKKIRNLRKFFGDIENERLLRLDTSMYRHNTNVGLLYKFVKFVSSSYLYNTGKTHIISTFLETTGLAATSILGISALAPIYILFSSYDIYNNISSDSGETYLDKFKYIVKKGTMVGCIEVIKQIGTMYFGKISMIFGSIIIDGIVMIFDSKLNRRRSDELAKVYAKSMDKDIIKKLLLPTQMSLTFRILSKIYLPLDWLAHIPEAIVTTIFSSTKINKLLYLTGVPQTLNLINTVYKKTIYMIPALVTIYIGFKSFSVCMPYLSSFFEMMKKSSGRETFIEGMENNLSNFVSENWTSVSQSFKTWFIGDSYTIKFFMILFQQYTTYILPLISHGIGIVSGYAEKGVLTCIKLILSTLYEKKQIVNFFASVFASKLISGIQINPFLKKRTQHFLAFVAPAFYNLYSSSLQRNVVSEELYIDTIKNSMIYGVIGLASSFAVNVVAGLMLSTMKDKNVINQMNIIDKKYNSSPSSSKLGKLSKSSAKIFSKIWYMLNNNFLFYVIDKHVTLTNSKFSEWVDINYGRNEYVSNLNFTYVANKIVIDEYFNNSLHSCITDVLTNADKLMELSSQEKQFEGVNLNKEKLKNVINKRRKQDMDNKIVEIENKKRYTQEFKNLERENNTIISNIETIKREIIFNTNKKIGINDIIQFDKYNNNIIKLKRELNDFVIQSTLLNKNIAIINDKIGLSDNKINQIDIQTQYYNDNEKILENPVTQVYKEDSQIQIANILINKFIPFISPIDPKSMNALRSDQQTQINRVKNRLITHDSKIKNLTDIKEKIIHDINYKNISLNEGYISLENLNKKYEDITSGFNNDKELSENIEYLQSINDIIIKQYSMKLSSSSSDITTFYTQNRELFNMKEQQTSFINTTRDLFSKKIFIEREYIDSLKSGIVKDEEVNVTQLGEFDIKVKKIRDERKRDEKYKNEIIHNKKSGINTVLEDMFKLIIDKPIEIVSKLSKKLIIFGVVKKREVLKKLDELKEIEANIKTDKIIDETVKNNLLETINDRKEEQINILKNVNYIVKNGITGIQQDFLKDSKRDKNDQIDKINNISFVKKIDTKIDTKIKIDTNTDIDIDIDYETIYETAFGGTEGNNEGSTPYVGEDLNEFSDLNNALGINTGVKIPVSSFNLNEQQCLSSSEPLLREYCILKNKFIESIPQDLKNELELIKSKINKQVSGFSGNIDDITREVDENLLFMHITPEYKNKLKEFKISNETKSLLKEIMLHPIQGGNKKGGGRLFEEYFKDKEIDWSNIHLLYLLSKKTMYMDYVSNILLLNNADEFSKKEEKLYNEKDKHKRQEIEEIDKLNKLASTQNIKVDKIRQDVSEEYTQKTFTGAVWALATFNWNYILSYGATSIASATESVGLGVLNDFTFQLIDLIDGYGDKRDTKYLYNEYISQIERVKDKKLKEEMKGQLEKWKIQAEKVDIISKDIYKTKQSQFVQYSSEHLHYKYLQSSLITTTDMSGIISPTNDNILHMFFADDELGIKKKYVTELSLGIPEHIMSIQKSVQSIIEQKINKIE
jgi:hypothetical protein